jgi:hypothetical protein
VREWRQKEEKSIERGKCVIHSVSVQFVVYWMLGHDSFLVVMHQVLGRFLQSVYPSMKGLNICLGVTRKLSLETHAIISDLSSVPPEAVCVVSGSYFLLFLSFVECSISFLFGLHFEPEGGREMFRRDVGFSPNCMELQSRSLYPSSWYPKPWCSVPIPRLSIDAEKCS